MNTEIQNPDVSFPKNAFIQDNFNVDKFLQEYCSKFGLHKLHKELNIYIKYLQQLMIDIVNSESGAIVHLSSDLKILQKHFENISLPLGQFKEEVTQIYKILDFNLSHLETLLSKKQNISGLKSRKINKVRILMSCQKIGNILSDKQCVTMETLERSVDQFILQQMYCQNCNVSELKNQIVYSTNLLNKTLNCVFLDALREKNTDYIVRCLQLFMLINNQKIAENIVAKSIIRPKLNEIINENYLQLCNNDLSILYNRILQCVADETKLILNLTSKFSANSNYNFLLTIFDEIDEQLKLNLSSIYAPGNPKVFHLRYLQNCEFLSNYKALFTLENEAVIFVQHDSYLSQKSLWNLDVYFEIRHLEILESVEILFSGKISENDFVENDENGFKLRQTCQLWKAINKCFSDDFYLRQLIDKYWKLVLQIISRYLRWCGSVLEQQTDFTSLPTASPLKSLTHLHLDTSTLTSKLSHPFTLSLPALSTLPSDIHALFAQSLTPCIQNGRHVLSTVENVIVNNVSVECFAFVRQINQIPRLFRKTNRVVPVGPSAYLGGMVAYLGAVFTLFESEFDEDKSKELLRKIYEKIVVEYKTLVQNVLTSVTKTEESLKRLKKIRSVVGNPDNTELTDDQKIKLQVQLDITFFHNEGKQYLDSDSWQQLLSLIK